MEKAKSLVESIKERVSRSGGSKSVVFYLKKDGRARVRFLQDAEDGIVVTFHDKWGEFNHPCLKHYGKNCPNCNNSEARTTDNYCWSVYNYETKQVELFLFKANRNSPLPSIVAMYENFGTLLDRDFIIQRNGSGTDTNYTVIPCDKKRFNVEVDPYSKKKALDLILKAFPYDGDIEVDEGEDEEEEEYEETRKKRKTNKKSSRYDDDDEEEDDEEYDEEDEEEEEEEKKPKRKAKKSKPKPKSKKDYDFEVDDDGFDDEEEDEEEEDEEEYERPKKKSRR